MFCHLTFSGVENVIEFTGEYNLTGASLALSQQQIPYMNLCQLGKSEAPLLPLFLDL